MSEHDFKLNVDSLIDRLLEGEWKLLHTFRMNKHKQTLTRSCFTNKQQPSNTNKTPNNRAVDIVEFCFPPRKKYNKNQSSTEQNVALIYVSIFSFRFYEFVSLQSDLKRAQRAMKRQAASSKEMLEN